MGLNIFPGILYLENNGNKYEYWNKVLKEKFY